MSTVADYEPVVARRSRVRSINPRLVIVVAVFALLVGLPVYSLVKAELNHGVERVAGGFHVDLKALGDFQFDEVQSTIENVPPRFRELDGKRVTMEGFVVPTDSASDHVQVFQFVYNVQKCCFGGPPKVQERVFAVAKRHAVANSGEEVSLTGTLHVNVIRDPESQKVVSVYTVDVDHVDAL